MSKGKTLHQNPSKLPRSNTIKFSYIWQTSIPDSWNKILARKNIHKICLNKYNRNTLGFLEETQKYISRICSPTIPDEFHLTPSSCKSQESPKSFSKLTSLSPSITQSRLSPIHRVSFKLAKRYKSINSQFLLKQVRINATSPGFRSTEENSQRPKTEMKPKLKKFLNLDLKLN